MKNFLSKLKNKENLSFDESKIVFKTIMEGKANENEIYSFLILIAFSLPLFSPISNETA